MPQIEIPTPLHEPRVVEGEVNLEGAAMLGPANEAAEQAQEQDDNKQQGTVVLIAVPQKLDNGQIALVIVGQAQLLKGVVLAADQLNLGG